jgi:hypothetical protein
MKPYQFYLIISFILSLTACQSPSPVKNSPPSMTSKGWLCRLFSCSPPKTQPKPTQRSCFSNLPARSQATQRQVFLLATGANTGEGDRELTQTHQDIQLFTEAMKQHFAIPEKQICRLDNVFRQEFETALMNLRKVLNPNDLAIIYFSGHGSRVRDDNGDEDKNDGWDEILITYDVKLKGYENEEHALRDDRFVALVNALPTKKVLTVMDSCFSGGMRQIPGKNDSLINARRKLLVKGVFGTQQPNRVTNPSNLIKKETGEFDSLKGLLWAAASEEEYSLEIPKQGGLFTTTFVEQLAQERNLCTAFKKTANLVREKTQSREPPQTPQAEGDWEVLEFQNK